MSVSENDWEIFVRLVTSTEFGMSGPFTEDGVVIASYIYNGARVGFAHAMRDLRFAKPDFSRAIRNVMDVLTHEECQKFWNLCERSFRKDFRTFQPDSFTTSLLEVSGRGEARNLGQQLTSKQPAEWPTIIRRVATQVRSQEHGTSGSGAVARTELQPKHPPN